MVLKVGGNEVTAGSSSREQFYEERADNDKTKEKREKKKRKKDKDRSNPGSPAEDGKKRKKMTKKRKGQEADADREESERKRRTPVHSALLHSLAKREEKEQTPLQEALSQLIRQIQRKDPGGLFAFPVTDLIAPGYSMVIRRPMDFSAMKDKVRKEHYTSLEELAVDLRIMCDNAMIYNKPETIYHKAARKLLHSGMKILSPERIESLRQNIEFMNNLGPGKKDEGRASTIPPKDGAIPSYTSENSQSPRTLSQEKDSKDEISKMVNQAEKDLEEIRKVIAESGGKLSNRGLQSELEFARRRADGSTTLAILNPAELAAGDAGYCPVKLGMMSNRLQSGVNTLQGFREDKRNMITPVCYTSYGPFTSFAPAYDSSFANISKEDTDLIYCSYGEETSVEGQQSISDFLAKSEEHMFKLADNLLDALTNGEHSKTITDTEETSPDGDRVVVASETISDVREVVEPEASDGKSRLASLTSVMGLDLLGLEEEDLSEEAQHFQTKLDETTKLLRELQEAQRERLSAKHPPNTICLLAPTAKELQLAEQVTGNLAQLTSQVAPGDVSSTYGIRRAMGISLPAEPEEPWIDLTAVAETAMDTSPVDQQAFPVITV